MKILLVEDDEDKREQLINFIKESLTEDVIEVRSFKSGLKAIKENIFNLILLDMTIPTFDISPTEAGGRSQPFGGEMLLYEMLRRGIKTKVIVVSQFDVFGVGEDEITLKDLDLKLLGLFKENYLGAVQYSIKLNGWKTVLIDKISKANLV